MRSRSTGVKGKACASSGLASGRKSPRARRTQLRSSVVASRSASASLSAQTTATPRIAYGSAAPAMAGSARGSSASRRRRRSRRNDARTRSRRRPCRQAARYSRSSRAARSAAAGRRPASHARCGTDGLRKGVALEQRSAPGTAPGNRRRRRMSWRRRSANEVTGSVPGARPRPRSMRPGNSASSTLKRSATISGAWFGSITPPEPTRMRVGHGRDLADHDVGRGAGDRRQVVMLGHPVAGEAEPLGELREVDRVAQRRRAGRTGGDRREIEDGNGNTRRGHSVRVVPAGATANPSSSRSGGRGGIAARCRGRSDRSPGCPAWPTAR